MEPGDMAISHKSGLTTDKGGPSNCASSRSSIRSSVPLRVLNPIHQLFRIRHCHEVYYRRQAGTRQSYQRRVRKPASARRPACGECPRSWNHPPRRNLLPGHAPVRTGDWIVLHFQKHGPQFGLETGRQSPRRHHRLNGGRSQTVKDVQLAGQVRIIARATVNTCESMAEASTSPRTPNESSVRPAGLDDPTKEAVRFTKTQQVITGDAVAGVRIRLVERPGSAA